MHAVLTRFAYTPTETQGRLSVNGFECFTIERPWIPHERPGGKPFRSCVPDGNYRLVPFTRTNGDRVHALVNDEIPVGTYQGNRYAILIHAGNYVDDVVGCIAPGRKLLMLQGRMMVTHSNATLTQLYEFLHLDSEHTLTIQPCEGAKDERENPSADAEP